MEDVQLNGHYWDDVKTIPKYKIEHNNERLKSSKLQQSLRTQIYDDIRVINGM